MKVVILAFNIGISKGLVNGPGMSLYNFAKFVSKYLPKMQLSIYTYMESSSVIPGIEIKTTKQIIDLLDDIKHCNAFHCWSGLTDAFLTIVRLANTYRKPVILGPNLLDTVEYKKEKAFLNNIEYKTILTVNDRLKYSILDKHALLTDKVESFIVGPDIDTWHPPDKYGKYILWKGNSRHMVKDIGFAKEVKNKLKQYEFLFLGDGRPYKYSDHIETARRAHLYVSTSLSETKGMALMEQWAAGVPSVTHPKIYQHGENYKTGIITNRDIDSYCDAISEIMENSKLRNDLSLGARKFILENFNPKLITEQYFEIIKDVS
ncbi:hypothetical protein CMI41_04780 [Candidatus Pacearchaeota archaeon]|nr:hypothetical protein [Candidatus Pacearchaeota archaeon]